MTGDDEHRLNPTRIDSIRSALAQIRVESPSPADLVTTGAGRFFSNGYDLAWSDNDPDRVILMSKKLRSLIRDLNSFPMPTIAAISGHASAGGFILALAHNYVLMRKDLGFLYMSEMDIKLMIPTWFTEILKCKIGSTAARRAVVMRAKRVTATAAVEMGIIDSAHDSTSETVKAAMKLGEELVTRKWAGHVYAQNRMCLFADVLPALDFDETMEDVKAANVLTHSQL